MRSAIGIFWSRAVFRQKNNEMAGEYEIDAGGNRGSLLTVILGNVLWTLKLQELVNQADSRSTLECFRQRILSTERVDLSLHSSFGASATAHGRAPPRQSFESLFNFLQLTHLDN